ncbi:recombinase family protein [Flavobacteriales bacterium]|nr:recombinase family protein [Flavobacteriales bacterium]
MARVSSDEQAKGYSLDVQSEALERYCQRNDIEIVYTFREDHSAKNFDRPAFKEFMEHAKRSKGGIDLLLFTTWDRFSRNILDAYVVIDQLKKMNILPDAIEQPIDLSIPENKLLLALYLAIPEVDNDRRSMKTRGGINAALKAGRWCRRAPYGYKNTRDDLNKPLIVPNEHAKDIRWAFEQILKGKSQRDIQRELNLRGCPIQRNALGNALKNPMYMGKIEVPAYERDPYQMVEGVHEGIIPEKLFYQVQDVLEGNLPKKRISKTTQNAVLPLRGILKCSKCEAKLTGSRSRGKLGTRYAYYHCNKCGKERYRADRINDLMKEVLNSIQLDNDLNSIIEALGKQLIHTNGKERQVKIAKLESTVSKQTERITRLQDNLADGVISSDDYVSMRGRYTAEKEEATKELKRLKQDDGENEALLKKVVGMINELGTYYEKSEGDAKIRLLGSIFPEMIEFDGTKCRTPSINEGLALCLNADKGLSGNKNGTIHENLELSRLVRPKGFELRSL